MEQVSEKWEEILQHIQQEHNLSDTSLKTWLKPLQIYAVENNTVYILVPASGGQMMITYLQRKYQLPLIVAIAEVTGREFEIEFILPENAEKMNLNKNNKSKSFHNKEFLDKSSLNANYTFDTFVVGNNNRFAHSASLAVAESPGEVYNPLFLYGGVGLGKTHLMHSIAHFINENNPDMKILYVSSENFTNDLIEAIRNGNNSAMTKFREKYRNIDILLIDDIQFIIGKESTQEEFFHTFNELYLVGKQIVISSDKPPKEMETLEERIRSRFECGLIADIGSPDYETRMAILRRKEEIDNFILDDEILNYIATNIKSNIRELEGALNKLQAYYNLEHQEITMEVAKKELQNLISPDAPKEVTPNLIIDVVCEHFNITNDQVVSKSRSKDIAKPRQIAMYLCKEMTDTSLDGIGALLGGRDHSTVIHGIKETSKLYESDDNIKNTIDTIKKKINPN